VRAPGTATDRHRPYHLPGGGSPLFVRENAVSIAVGCLALLLEIRMLFAVADTPATEVEHFHQPNPRQLDSARVRRALRRLKSGRYATTRSAAAQAASWQAAACRWRQSGPPAWAAAARGAGAGAASPRTSWASAAPAGLRRALAGLKPRQDQRTEGESRQLFGLCTAAFSTVQLAGHHAC